MGGNVTLAWKNDTDRTISDYISRTSTGTSITNNSYTGTPITDNSHVVIDGVRIDCRNIVGIYEPKWCVTDKDLTKVKKIIFSPPATIVIWEDGHKEVVKCSDDEEFEPEVGVAMCFMKRIFESRNKFAKLVDDAWLDYVESYVRKVRYHEKRLKDPKAKVRTEKKFPEW